MINLNLDYVGYQFRHSAAALFLTNIVSEWLHASAHRLQEKSNKNRRASAEIWCVRGSNDRGNL